ncbi:MAG TPA: phosphotransferase [Rhizomicrobium sp.]|nr:phosphotransferase [Rhizomicrobium sp.]
MSMTAHHPRHALSDAVSGDDFSTALLKGHSGAQLEICDREGAIVVRKTAADKGRSMRLLDQARLQRRLSHLGVPLPRVLAQGTGPNGRAFFEMDYVPARNLAQSLRDGADICGDATVEALARTLRFFQSTQDGYLSAAPFLAKIHQIKETCAVMPGCESHRAEIATTAARLGGLPWNGVPSSLAHGDMTLENVLFAPKLGAVFVDCDGGFPPSYWLDAAKLFQDLDGEWCLRDLYIHGGDMTAARLRLELFGGALRVMLAMLDRELVLRLPQFVALHLFRTLPYAGDARVVGFVLERISSVLDRAAAR